MAEPLAAESLAGWSFPALLECVRPLLDRALTASWDTARQQHAGLGLAVTAPLEAARALCLRGGKRLRAALVVVGYRVAGGGPDLAAYLPVCCAVELLHAYFLIHDDWMDQDELRRGGPTVHAALGRQFASAHLGAAGAVLAGDYTLALATRELAQADLPHERRAAVLARFVSMQLDAVVGQQLDVLGSSPGGASNSSSGAAGNLDDVYRLKTGSYTVLGPLQLGTALGAAPAELDAALEAFALPLGIAFQLRDDLLGAFGDPAQTGKPRGNDLVAGKRTLLLQAALANVSARAALAPVVGNSSAAAEAVERALAAISACGARASVETRIEELTQRARTALGRDVFDSASRGLLEGVLSALVDRGQ